jgi:hypothetical protein
MLSCESLCYHEGENFIKWGAFYHVVPMFSCGENVIMWKLMCYHVVKMLSVGLMLSCGANVIMWKLKLSNVIIWDQMLSFGANDIIWSKCYYVEADAVMRDEMLSCGSSVIMWSNCNHLEAYVIMWTKC